MGFYIASDAATLRVVESVAIFVFALISMMLALVLLLRVRLSLRERRRQRFLSVWRPILVKAVEFTTADLPTLASRDLLDFLVLWNHLHESVLDVSKDRLNEIAKALNVGEAARRMLHRRNIRDRFLAIITVGNLRERAAWDELLSIARSGGALLSAVAARGLVMIDSHRAAPQLMPLLITRTDWPVGRAAAILQSAGPDAVSDLIAEAAVAYARSEAVSTADRGDEIARIKFARRLIGFFPLTHRHSALPAVRSIVESSKDPEVLGACLELFRSSLGAPFARECLTHTDWRVRVHAAAALGRIGQAEDQSALMPLLSDSEWWVRYRAAQALSRLPSVDISKLKSIQAIQSDPLARDMLAQVIAEVQLQ